MACHSPWINEGFVHFLNLKNKVMLLETATEADEETDSSETDNQTEEEEEDEV